MAFAVFSRMCRQVKLKEECNEKFIFVTEYVENRQCGEITDIFIGHCVVSC